MAIPFYITVDGIDGCGKTTVIKHIQKRCQLENHPHQPIIVRALGEGTIGQSVRARALHGIQRQDIVAEAFSVAAAHIETVADFIVPALDRGQSVLEDRYISTYYAYQFRGNDSQVGGMMYDMLSTVHDRYAVPDLYIYLDVDKETAMQRLLQTRGHLDNLDSASPDFKDRARVGFDEFYQDYAHPKVKINAAQPLEKMLSDIDKALALMEIF